MDGFFVVFRQPAKLHQPAKGALYHPSAWKHLESTSSIAPLDDLKDPTAKAGHPVDQFAGITAIRPYQTKPRERTKQLHAYELCAVSVLNACAMHDDGDYQTRCVYGEVPFASFDLFAGIVTVVPPF